MKGCVWHLTSNRWNSAITEYALSCARATKALGHRVVFSPLAGTPAERRAREVDLEVREVSAMSASQWWRISKMAREIRADWIFVYGGPETTLAKLLKASRGIYRFRGHDLKKASTALSRLTHRLGHTHVSAVLVPSAHYREALRTRGFGHPRTVVIGLGVDDHLYRPVSLDQWPVRNELIIFGRLDPVKGHVDFASTYVHAKSLWGGPNPFPKLRIVGEEANLKKSQLIISLERLGLVEGVDFEMTVERVQDARELLSRSLLGVVSSLGSEVICRVAQEFLLCGTPILVSGVGSLEELLAQRGFGRSYAGLSPEGRARQLCEVVEEAQREPVSNRLSRSMMAREQFSLTAMTKALAPLLSCHQTPPPSH
jgi:glycosyltransferase involved in cell wall biosynthesis